MNETTNNPDHQEFDEFMSHARKWLRDMIKDKNEIDESGEATYARCELESLIEVVDTLIHHCYARKSEAEANRELLHSRRERFERTIERNKDWEESYREMQKTYDDERKFRDHIQEHLDAMSVNGEVCCKICGKTINEITGRD